MLQRLQKILSERGIASRRKAEEYIERGLVKVNGKVAIIGQKADPEVDEITVEGKVLEERAEMLYYLLYKPRGVETVNIEGGTRGKDQTVRDLLPAALQGKIFPVGRLDKDSEGLLLMTNDGVLAYRLTHPKFDHEKEYEVELLESISDRDLLKMEKGMMIDGAKTKPTKIQRLSPNKFRIALTEGKNRQIRRMCRKVNGEVTRLIRVRIMTLRAAQMKSGDLRLLNPSETAQLLASVKV